MTKRLLINLLGFLLLFCLSSGLATHALLYSGGETLSIKTGTVQTSTRAGHCAGYCTQEFVITPYKIIYTQIANSLAGSIYPKGFQPIIKQEIPFTLEKWSNLLRVNAYADFQKLPNTIGCTDCADGGGAEWIEVNQLDRTDPKTLKRFYSTKKVTFQYGSPLPANNAFAEKLRQLRLEIIKQYGKK
jgi:hypothetical protein